MPQAIPGRLRTCSVVIALALLAGCGTAPAPVSKQDASKAQSRGDSPRDANETPPEAPLQTAADLPPERTPENDPNLTRSGPKLGVARRLASANASCERFSPACRFIVYHDPPNVVAVSLDQPDQPPRELARLPFAPLDLRVLNDELDLLVLEAEPEEAGRFSSEDPLRIWWVDHSGTEKQLLRGPEKDLSLVVSPVSHDRRFVAFHRWQDNADAQGLSRGLFIIDRRDESTVAIQVPKAELSVVDWKQADEVWRAVAIASRWKTDGTETSDVYLVDPTTGELEADRSTEAAFWIDKQISPDGRFRVRIEQQEIVVTTIVDNEERRFIPHPDDLAFVHDQCVEWISPRYLKFNGPRLALIDAVTMKMSFPAPPAGLRINTSTCKFSPDHRWVMFHGESVDGAGLFVAAVEVPDEPAAP